MLEKIYWTENAYSRFHGWPFCSPKIGSLVRHDSYLNPDLNLYPFSTPDSDSDPDPDPNPRSNPNPNPSSNPNPNPNPNFDLN